MLVLRLLASAGESSAQTLEYHWPGLTESAARSAVERLAMRGLVDAAGWDSSGRRRTYALTAKGREVEAKLNVDDESEDGVS